MSRSPARRPTLLPSTRRLWRSANLLQLGTDPGRAVILDLTDPASARVLDLLDGSRTEQTLLRDTARLAIPPDEVRELVGELRQAGYVVDAHTLRPAGSATLSPTARRRLEHEAAALALRQHRRGDPIATPATRLRRRQNAHVLVTGTGHLGLPIATALASAGVGHIDPMIPAVAVPGEIGTTQTPAEVLRQTVADVDLTPIRRDRASFAVLVGVAGPTTLTALTFRRVAHLAVRVRDGTVVVGPLVRPGVTACLNCLDLHRIDRDPAWRILAAQLQDTPDADPVAATTALAGAAVAAAEVLTYIDGGTPDTLGATVEIAAAGDAVKRRWAQHPACGCARRRRTRTTEPPAERT